MRKFFLVLCCIILISCTETKSREEKYLNRGITLASQGKFELAIKNFTKTIKLNPNLSTAYLLRGRAVYANVFDVIDIAENFDRVGVLFTYGKEKSDEQLRAFDQAITDFTEAIRLDENNAVAYSDRGDAYLQKGELDKAIADYDQAISLNPKYAWAYKNVANAYSYKEDEDKAIEDYTQSIIHDPAYPYYNRGNRYLAKKDYDQAIENYTQAIRLNPNFEIAYYSRGMTYDLKGDYDQAIEDYTQSIRLNHNDFWAYYYRGRAYILKGKYDQAIEDNIQSIRLNPNMIKTHGINLSYAIRCREKTQMITDHINAFADVDNANLTIIFPFSDGPFEDVKPASANVVITPKPGSDITTNRKKIEVIQKLLKLAVEELKDENIIITDQNGIVLNDFPSMADHGSFEYTEREQKQIQYLEAKYRAEILRQLLAIYGSDRVRDLFIKIDMDMSKKANERIFVSVNIDGKWEFKYDEKYKFIISPDGIREREYIPISYNELRNVVMLIQEAIGYNPNRGDSVTVQNIPFDRSKQFADEDAAFFRWQKKGTISFFLFGLIIIYIIISLIFSILGMEGMRNNEYTHE